MSQSNSHCGEKFFVYTSDKVTSSWCLRTSLMEENKNASAVSLTATTGLYSRNIETKDTDWCKDIAKKGAKKISLKQNKNPPATRASRQTLFPSDFLSNPLISDKSHCYIKSLEQEKNIFHDNAFNK